MSATQVQICLGSHDLSISHQFYSTIIGCSELERVQDEAICYNFFNHILWLYQQSPQFVPHEHCNNVDLHDVPVPHFGMALTVQQFHTLSEKFRQRNVKFIIQPHLRFQGKIGEQYTMFFKDPSGNNLEFKAMTHPENLFAK